nr:hypothetical protein HK105_008211 [Polyrhizophydium stewartii]
MPKSLQDRLAETTDPMDRARLLREMELSQIERRFRALGFSSKPAQSDPHATSVTLDIVPSDPDFPFELATMRVELTVPALFPTDRACTMTVLNDEIPAMLKRNVERAWFKRVTASKLSLMDMLAWLDKNLEALLIEKQDDMIVAAPRDLERDKAPPEPREAFVESSEAKNDAGDAVNDDDGSDDGDDGDDDDDDDDDDDEEQGDGNGGVRRDAEDGGNDDDGDQDAGSDQEAQGSSSSLGQMTSAPRQRGTQIKIPSPTLGNIALLHCMALSVTLRCMRCKDMSDARKLAPAAEDSRPKTSTLTCKTCQSALSVAFRRDLVHMASTSLGFLDLRGATAFDLMPSTYVATCAGCDAEHIFSSLPTSTPITEYCRSCHVALTLNLGQVKFAVIGGGGGAAAGGSGGTPGLPRKKKLDKLEAGIVVGTPLPSNGTCSHFKRSFRWFRFPCCGKLYPCLSCHEEQKPDKHEMLWANRMVCGFCSREQPYSADKPCVCGRDLTRKDGGGFWEGGKGTRDRTRMSNKDSRKYRGLGKTISNRAMNKAKSH